MQTASLRCAQIAILAFGLLAGNVLPVHAADVMILSFTQTACEPCRQVQPFVQELVRNGSVVRQVDVTREASLAQRWQVTQLPTIVLLQDGEEVDRIVGAVTVDHLRQRLAAYVRLPEGTTEPPVSSPDELRLTASQDAPLLMSAVSQSGNVGTNQSSGPYPPLSSSDAPTLSQSSFDSSTMSPVEVRPASYEHSSAHEPSFATASMESPQEFRSNASSLSANVDPMAASVRIRVDENSSFAFGTGTIIDQHGADVLVLTCGHLFRGLPKDAPVTVEVYQNGRTQQYNASVVDFECEQIDIGLIAFQTSAPMSVVPLRPASEVLHEGETVFSIGCDHGADPTRRDSQITKLNRYLGPPNVEVGGAPVQGRSGGGLFDSQGRLVGVCYAADSELNEGLYSAPAIVYHELSKVGLQHLFEQKMSPAPQVASNTVQQSVAPVLPQVSPNRTMPQDDFPDSMPPRSSAASIINSAGLSNAADRSDLTVIVRDASGQQRVLQIPDAPASLVQSLQLQAIPTDGATRTASSGMTLR